MISTNVYNLTSATGVIIGYFPLISEGTNRSITCNWNRMQGVRLTERASYVDISVVYKEMLQLLAVQLLYSTERKSSLAVFSSPQAHHINLCTFGARSM